MNAQDRTFDVVMASDLRLPGGTVSSMVEEIKALHHAGYTVGLIQVFSPLVARPRPMNQSVRDLIHAGAAELLVSQDSATSRLAVLRHPGVFQDPGTTLPRLTVQHVTLVANQAVADRDGRVHYDVDAVDRSILQWLKKPAVWAPIGPLVRAGLQETPVALHDEDWLNVIDVDEWAAQRDSFRDVVPVIGRHSRPHPAKWPASRADLLAAYPDTADVRVRVLGGAEEPAKILGGIPSNWQVEAFGARPPREFLSEIDFFVYYPRAETVEAFGRTVMEAMASGAVAILDPRLEPSFGAAALYAPPRESAALVQALFADREAYRRQSDNGQAWVRRQLGHERHVARVRELIGAPSRSPERRPDPRRKPTVLYVSSNGAGMGHLTRLLAMARRSADWCRPMFLSLSQAVPVVGAEGFAYEYFPSRGALGIETGVWNPMFEERFRQALDDHRPSAVVFDGTWPYLGLIRSRRDYPETRFIWSRRAMWKSDTPPDQLEKSQYFDLVIEPGEFATEYDEGPTVRDPAAEKVEPITYLDRGELLSRAQARSELGIGPDAWAILVALGAGNINDISGTVGALLDGFESCDGVEVLLTESPIALEATHDRPNVKTLSIYPLSRHYNAFDASVNAAGYNAFHECLAFGLPTLFVPNMDTRTDDQAARSRWARDNGCGWSFTKGERLGDQLAPLLDRREAAAIRRRLESLNVTNGAERAAALVRQLVESNR